MSFDTLKKKVLELEADYQRSDNGNKSAGTRVRKGLQEVKKLSDQLRKSILDNQKEQA